MARRLTDLGYKISAIYDRHAPSAQALALELETTAAESLADVSAASDVIFTVVTDDAAMHGIFTGDGSLLSAPVDGKLFINCATVSPASHEEAAAAAKAVGADTLAASMASSITQAREGTLYLMIGGEQAVFDRAKELLGDISASLKYVGVVGNSAKAKALVNMVMNINTAGLAEGLGLGVALGLDPIVMKEIFSETGANSRVLETDGDDMISREHDVFFSASHAAKDSGIANALAHVAGISVPVSEATQAQYQRLIDLGLGELDKSGVAELTFPGRGGANLDQKP